MRRAGLGGALLTAAAALLAAACAPSPPDTRADSAPVQAGPPVLPPAGVGTGTSPAPTLPETVEARRSPTPTPPRVGGGQRRDSAGTKRSAADTLEYDRAIPYKPDPRNELPVVRPE